MHALDDKAALITGGTSGIGLAVARNFLECGARVQIAGRREQGEAIAADIGAGFIQCDAADEADVARCFETAAERLGPLDIAVLNAGCAADEGSIETFDSEGMHAIVDLNLKGAFFALKHGPQHLKDAASIIYTGSVTGSGLTHAGGGVYAASKAGGAYLVRASAIELAPRQIRVNAICPALIADTGMMVADDGNAEARFLATLTAFGRMGRQDEVVGLYNFLASDAAAFITGQEICVDGGMTAGLGLPVFGAIAGE